LTTHQINLHQNISQEKILIFDHQPVLGQTCPITSNSRADETELTKIKK
jgi:hypothetical protein